MNSPDFEALLQQKLAANQQIWKTLLERGVAEETVLRLDFFFDAPDRDAADALVSFLQQETDYDLQPPYPSGSLWRKKWSVSGSTQETTVSLDILNQWVEWMVAAGRQSGGCAFDGWGTELP